MLFKNYFRLPLLGILFSLFLSCEKECEKKFVDGELLFRPNNLVPINDLVISLCDYDDFIGISYLYGYEYLLVNPQSAKEDYLEIFNSKKYLKSTSRGPGFYEIDSDFVFIIPFIDIKNEEAIDWTKLKDSLQLKQINNGYKWGSLIIKEGKEEEMIGNLELNNLIKSATLNHIVCIE